MNPYVIIGLLIGYIIVGGAGWHYGSEYAEGKAAKDKAAALSAAAAAHNANAAIDMQAAADVEAEKWKKRLNALKGRHALEMDIVRRTPPAECRSFCDLDAASVDLMRQRARDINSAKEDPAGKRPGGVSAPAGDPKRGAGDAKALR